MPFEKRKGNIGEDAVRLYLEEILADQYSGMNRGGNEAARAREAVAGTAQRFAGDIENARQNRAGIDNRNGPGQRFASGGLDRPNDEVNWAVDESIIDWKDRKRLYEAFADIKKRGYNHTKTEAGEYLIDNDNKIMFVSGSFSHPRLTRVIVFNDNSATRWQYARDYIYKETARSGRYDAARRFIEAAYGERYAELYNAKDDGRNAWEIQRGEGETGGEIYRGDSESDAYDGEIDWTGKSSDNQRFSTSEDEEDDGLTFSGDLRRTYEEDGTQKEGTPPHPSPAATPSPQGEGLETGETDSSAAPQNDSGEDFEMLAREKKLALAEKVGIDGLKSRLESAEGRLRMWKGMEKSGRRIQKNLTRFGKLFLQSTEKCFPKLRFSIHRSNGNLNDTSTFNFSFSTFNFFDMLKSPPWVIPGRAFCRYISVRTGSSARSPRFPGPGRPGRCSE